MVLISHLSQTSAPASAARTLSTKHTNPNAQPSKMNQCFWFDEHYCSSPSGLWRGQRGFKGEGFSSRWPRLQDMKNNMKARIANIIKFQTGWFYCRFHTRMHRASESCPGLSKVWGSHNPRGFGTFVIHPASSPEAPLHLWTPHE